MSRHKLSQFFNQRKTISAGLKSQLESEERSDKLVLKKGQFLLVPRMAIDEIHYLVSGLCKAYWLNNDNEQVIFFIWAEDGLVMLAEEFFAEMKNTGCYIEMIADSELLTISKTQYEKLKGDYPEMQQLMDIIRLELMEIQNQHRRILMEKEGDRYALFCELFPKALRARLTDKDVYRYIGISRSTLTLGKNAQPDALK
jgi:CRP-like cAMP-binding protein